MDTFGIYTNIISAFSQSEDWKSACKLSIAYGKNYTRDFKRMCATPIKRGEIVRISFDTQEKYYIVASISYSRKKPSHNKIELHRLCDPCDFSNGTLASPLNRSQLTGVSCPDTFKIPYDDKKDLYKKRINFIDLFGQVVFERL